MSLPASCGRVPCLARLAVLPVTMSLVLSTLLFPACVQPRLADTRSLEGAGFSSGSIQQLRALQVTEPEIAELVVVKNAGASEQTCVALLQIARTHNGELRSAKAVAALRRVGMTDESVLELARLDELGPWVEEVRVMRLAGISDPIILALGRLRAQGKPILSGSSVAQLKNAGMSEGTILELASHGVSDAQVGAIVTARRRGVSDSDILRRY